MTEQITVIMPAYNEEAAIGEVVRRTFAALPDHDVEVLVIDDASDDATSERAVSAGARVVRHPYNKGNGAAVRTALRNASHPICAIIDADGQHNPEEIPALLRHIGNADMVVGTRVEATYSRLRRFGNLFLNRLASFLCGQQVADLTSGFRVFRREVMLPYSSLLPNRFSFPSTSTLALLTDGFSVLFEPIRVNARTEGSESKLHPFKDGLKFVTIIFRIIHLFNPLKIYLPIGITILALGLVWSIRTIIATSQFSAGGILLLLAGIILVLMGFQIDQISSLRRQIGQSGL